MSGYFKTYTKSAYSSRGAMRTRDLIYEGVIARNCKICGKRLIRKVGRSGRPENLNNFFERKSCGNYWDEQDNRYRKSICLRKSLRAEENPKWRGGLPICQICKKRTKWYRNIKKNNPQRYCKECFNIILGKINKQRGRLKKGIYPEVLRKFSFEKMHKPWNKKFDKCQLKVCENKHLAKGLCSKHYQAAKPRTNTQSLG